MMDDDKIPQINRVAKVIKVDEQNSNDVKSSGEFMLLICTGHWSGAFYQ